MSLAHPIFNQPCAWWWAENLNFVWKWPLAHPSRGWPSAARCKALPFTGPSCLGTPTPLGGWPSAARWGKKKRKKSHVLDKAVVTCTWWAAKYTIGGGRPSAPRCRILSFENPRQLAHPSGCLCIAESCPPLKVLWSVANPLGWAAKCPQMQDVVYLCPLSNSTSHR